jgi:hypothetical protein
VRIAALIDAHRATEFRVRSAPPNAISSEPE